MKWRVWVALLVCGCGAEASTKPVLTSVTTADAGALADAVADSGAAQDLGAPAPDVPSLPQDVSAVLDAVTEADAASASDAAVAPDVAADVPPSPDVVPPDVVPPADVPPPSDVAPPADVPPPPDVPPPADVPKPADAGPSYSHPLATVDEVALVMTAHGGVPLATRALVDRAYKLGGQACPGLLKVLQTIASDNFFNVCNVKNGALDVELFGAWDLSFDAPCLVANTLQKKWSIALPQDTTWYGTDDKQAVDLKWGQGLTINANYGPQPLTYAWQGNQKWSKLPAAWLPEGTKTLVGHSITGSAVQRTATTLGGVLTIDGLTVAVDTPQPLNWSATCAQPTGEVRLTGKSTVLVTFAPGPNCAPPTWSRDGQPKGPLPLTWPTWTWTCQ